MSHIVSIKTEIRDAAAIRAACQRLRLDAPQQGKFMLFSGEAEGVAVQLSDWRYPLVCNTNTGELRYDNYNGRWGKQQELDGFLQSYAVEKTRIEARRKGHGITETKLPDGSVKLTIQVNGGAV